VDDIRGGPVGDPFELPHGFDNARDALGARFTDQRSEIDRVIGAMERVVDGVGEITRTGAESSIAGLWQGAMKIRSLSAHWRASVDDMLTREFGHNEGLYLALAGNLGYYADDPAKLWWLFFAVAQGGYLASGGTFIKGGSRTLTMRLARIVNKAGGRVWLNRNVISIEPRPREAMRPSATSMPRARPTRSGSRR